jgi:hypothetical protein
MPGKSPPRRIRLAAGKFTMLAELNDSETADRIWEALPIHGKGQVWGDEIYFSIPVKMPEQDAQREVTSGTLAYWPPGHAFCIFFGQRPYSAVNVVGKLLGTPEDWKKVKDGTEVTIEAANDKD